ncbi:MAG: hypothetical protein ACR2P5_07190 [Gammaproteobacteria bacterium]
MKKIFLDVGGHEGQTLEEVLKPDYRFDAVHCFEPQPEYCEHIRRNFSARIADGKLFAHSFGLADFDGERLLYGKGIGASVFSDKEDIDNAVSARCSFVRASAFFAEHIGKEDLAVMKLNCEGGEVLILRDLIKSGAVHSLANAMIDFDIRKIPSRRSEEKKITTEMAAAGFKNYTTASRSMVGFTHQERIRFWLSNLDCADEFMKLTPGEEKMRMLPFWMRRRIQKIRRKIKKIKTARL